MKFNWNEDSKFYVNGKELTVKQFFAYDLYSNKRHFAIISEQTTLEWGRFPLIRINKKDKQ